MVSFYVLIDHSCIVFSEGTVHIFAHFSVGFLLSTLSYMNVAGDSKMAP